MLNKPNTLNIYRGHCTKSIDQVLIQENVK